jgi:uncharacterized protein RhaS with RHS repeats
MSGQRLQDHYYHYDKVGNITSIDDRSYTALAKTTDYVYDDLYRLTRVSSTNAVDDNDYLQTLSYNALGNITNKSDVGSYSYASANYANPHAATSINGQTQTYDNNGNLTSDSEWTQAWDYKNRLTQSNKGTTTIRYAYDHNDERISYSVNGRATTTTAGRYYETDGTTNTKHVYAGNQLIASIKGTSTYYVHPDHLGGTNVVTDENADIVQLIDYYPFGEIRYNETSTDLAGASDPAL